MTDNGKGIIRSSVVIYNGLAMALISVYSAQPIFSLPLITVRYKHHSRTSQLKNDELERE